MLEIDELIIDPTVNRKIGNLISGLGYHVRKLKKVEKYRKLSRIGAVLKLDANLKRATRCVD